MAPFTQMGSRKAGGPYHSHHLLSSVLVVQPCCTSFFKRDSAGSNHNCSTMAKYKFFKNDIFLAQPGSVLPLKFSAESIIFNVYVYGSLGVIKMFCIVSASSSQSLDLEPRPASQRPQNVSGVPLEVGRSCLSWSRILWSPKTTHPVLNPSIAILKRAMI